MIFRRKDITLTRNRINLFCTLNINSATYTGYYVGHIFYLLCKSYQTIHF